jgi:hypothetical protein
VIRWLFRCFEPIRTRPLTAMQVLALRIDGIPAMDLPSAEYGSVGMAQGGRPNCRSITPYLGALPLAPSTANNVPLLHTGLKSMLFELRPAISTVAAQQSCRRPVGELGVLNRGNAASWPGELARKAGSGRGETCRSSKMQRRAASMSSLRLRLD